MNQELKKIFEEALTEESISQKPVEYCPFCGNALDPRFQGDEFVNDCEQCEITIRASVTDAESMTLTVTRN